MFRPKPSTIVASTALVVAIFGSAPLGQAAANLVLPRNSVGVTQLKNNAVTGLKVKDGTLRASDFQPGQLPVGAPGPKGATGPVGPAGPKGDKGDPGPASIGGYELVAGNTVTISPGQIDHSIAACPAGKKALSGGYNATMTLETQYFTPWGNTGIAWYVGAKNVSGQSGSLTAVVACANG